MAIGSKDGDLPHPNNHSGIQHHSLPYAPKPYKFVGSQLEVRPYIYILLPPYKLAHSGIMSTNRRTNRTNHPPPQVNKAKPCDSTTHNDSHDLTLPQRFCEIQSPFHWLFWCSCSGFKFVCEEVFKSKQLPFKSVCL